MKTTDELLEDYWRAAKRTIGLSPFESGLAMKDACAAIVERLDRIIDNGGKPTGPKIRIGGIGEHYILETVRCEQTTAKAGEMICEDCEPVDHPAHYGGASSVYEAIKVIHAWRLGFNLGNCLKYISRAGKKDPAKTLEDLKKARFYLDYEIRMLEGGK